MFNYNSKFNNSNILVSRELSPQNKNINLRKNLKECSINAKSGDLSFGSVNKLFEKAEKTIIKSAHAKRAGLFFNKIFNKLVEKGIGQNCSNFINYSGKAVLSPLMIFVAAPFVGKDDNDSIKFSALMQPIQGILAFTSATAVGLGVNKILDKQAKKGTLGNFIDKSLGYFFNTVKNPQGTKNLSILKDISTIGVTAAIIPVTGLIMNWVLPKIMNKIDPGSISKNIHNTMYAGSVKNLYARSINPSFGDLTTKNKNIFDIYNGIKKL